MSVLEQLQSKLTSTAVGADHSDWVNLMIDPIESAAVPYPDEWPHPTQATKLRMLLDVTSDANGYFAMAVGIGLTGGVRVFTVTAGNYTTANTTTNHPDLASYTATFSSSRWLCGGCKYVPSNTPENSAGIMGIISCQETAVTAYNGVAISAMQTDCNLWQVHEPMTYHRYCFGPPVFNTTHIHTDYAPTLLIVGRGCTPSKTLGSLEFTWNLEGVAYPASVHAGASKVTMYDPQGVMIGTHIAQGAHQMRAGTGRRLTASGRAIADASAAAFGNYMNPALAPIIGAIPAGVRTLSKTLKKKKKPKNKKN